MKKIIENKNNYNKNFYEISTMRKFVIFFVNIIFSQKIFDDSKLSDELSDVKKMEKKKFFNRCFHLFFSYKNNFITMIKEIFDLSHNNFEHYQNFIKKNLKNETYLLYSDDD